MVKGTHALRITPMMCADMGDVWCKTLTLKGKAEQVITDVPGELPGVLLLDAPV